MGRGTMRSMVEGSGRHKRQLAPRAPPSPAFGRRHLPVASRRRGSARLKTPSIPAICPPGSRVDVRVRQPGQVRKEAATTDGSGSPGSFNPHHCCHDIRGPSPYFTRMGDSGDIFGGEPPWEEESAEAKPSAAELEAAGQSALFGGPAEAPPAAPPPPKAQPSEPAQPYRVLARKYRPQTFS